MSRQKGSSWPNRHPERWSASPNDVLGVVVAQDLLCEVAGEFTRGRVASPEVLQPGSIRAQL
jgi:hypothetical protein